jgi:hypothetical protein
MTYGRYMQASKSGWFKTGQSTWLKMSRKKPMRSFWGARWMIRVVWMWCICSKKSTLAWSEMHNMMSWWMELEWDFKVVLWSMNCRNWLFFLKMSLKFAWLYAETCKRRFQGDIGSCMRLELEVFFWHLDFLILMILNVVEWLN